MIIRLFLTLFIFLGFNNFVYSSEINCTQFKKFSLNYVKCKASLVKNKTISVGKNFVEDTKKYQKKEWSEEKEKINKIKKKVLE